MTYATAAATYLWDAWQDGRTITELPAEVRPRNQAEAIVVQCALTERIGPICGWKVAATSPASQATLGVDGPMFGPMHERFRYVPGNSISLAGQTMRVAEPEFAFVMSSGVDDPSSVDAVLDSVDTLHVAVEIPDSRYVAFDSVDGLQILADGACTGSFVLGPQVDLWRDLDLASTPATIDRNGERFSEGTGAAALGDPRQSLCWLAAELARYGLALRRGDIVTTGTAAPPAPVAPGDEVTAEISGHATVSVAFR